MSTLDPAAFRDALPRAYGALLARFGHPTEIQLAAAEPLLAGRDVLLCAPTASGKTEAYLAPLVERHVPADECRGEPGPARVLVVSPTRALTNDLARRLAPHLATVGIEVGRWTGDHRDGGRLQPITVLTPESLDSRLARVPEQLADVRAVVLDELHVLDGAARGDQLAVLVHRLRVERGRRDGGQPGPLQVVAASATVPDPAAVAGRYLHDPVVVEVGTRRTVRARLVESRDPEAIRAELFDQVRAGFRKVLLFCNSRSDVEVLARALRGRPPFGHAVLAHHGSLARTRRLAAEKRFLTAPAAACVATSTMELGVDIGDVDLVALVGPPPDLPALLQRVGRGGRRRGDNHVVAFVSGSFEAGIVRTLLLAQAEGHWQPGPSVFRAGVLAQQALTICHARASRTVDADALHRRLPPWVAAEWPSERLRPVLDGLARAGWLAQVGGGRFTVDDKAETAWGRGELHDNLSGKAGVAVVDSLTGDTVGHVDRVERSLGLGGSGRRTLTSSDERVVTVHSGDPDLPLFAGGAGVAMPSGLSTVLLGGAGIPVPSRCLLPSGEVFFHGLGTGGGALLAAVLRANKLKIRRTGRFGILFESRSLTDAIERGRWPSPYAVEATLGLRHAGLARKLDCGSWHAALPESEQKAVVGALCEVDLVKALLAAGPPPVEKPTDEAAESLWDQAAWA